MKRAIVSVINDLVTDQRVHRTCMVLHDLGYDVLLAGRRQRKSMPLDTRPYRTKRMRIFFEKGFLFYAFFNMRLFLLLLFRKADVLVSNDLDTLLPNYLISRLKGSKLVYDTHEIFCEVPELQESGWKKKFWKRIERNIVPRLKYIFTVNKSIADYYQNEYKVELKVVKNIPAGSSVVSRPVKIEAHHHVPADDTDETVRRIQKEKRGIPPGKKIIILQGAGINIQRGAEEAVEAMQHVNGAVLYIIGGGDVSGALKKLVRELQLEEKVKFIAKLPYHELIGYTRLADIGLTLDKDTNINYRYSLPNKIFDYVHAGIAILASPLAEVKKIVEEYKLGELIGTHDPRHIAEKINFMLSDEHRLNEWKQNAKLAAGKLSWNTEKQPLAEVFRSFL